MDPATLSADPALSSLIFTLSGSRAERESALLKLASFPGLTLGAPQQRWVPGVLESASPQDAFRALEKTPGVDLVEVVYVEVSTPDASTGVPL